MDFRSAIIRQKNGVFFLPAVYNEKYGLFGPKYFYSNVTGFNDLASGIHQSF